MATKSKSASAIPLASTPKRTSIGEGRRRRNNQGRTNRSPARKPSRGQG